MALAPDDALPSIQDDLTEKHEKQDTHLNESFAHHMNDEPKQNFI